MPLNYASLGFNGKDNDILPDMEYAIDKPNT